MLHWKTFPVPGGGSVLVNPELISHAFTSGGAHRLRVNGGVPDDLEVLATPEEVAKELPELSFAYEGQDLAFRINPERCDYITENAQGVTLHLPGGTKITVPGGTIRGVVFGARAGAAHRAGRSIDDPPPPDVSIRKPSKD